MKYIIYSVISALPTAFFSLCVFRPETKDDEFAFAMIVFFFLCLPICLIFWHFQFLRDAECSGYQLFKRERIIKDKEERIEKIKSDISRIKDESLRSAPWLANFYADYLYALGMESANNLVTKSRPALKAADEVRRISAEKRAIAKELKLLQYQMSVYEAVAPWLEEFKDVNAETINSCIQSASDEDAKSEYDSIKRWLSKEEYDRLSTVARYQLALDRYKQSRKTKWEIGRDFERYVGFLYESGGSKVEYFGANKGLEDMGRDLVVHYSTSEGLKQTAIVQCKYWNENRTIHEKHIFQLYGTSVLYRIEHSTEDVRMAFVTTAPLSETAEQAAKMLDISIVNIAFEKDYPCIKCNINASTGQKIYHLPFDQQYDRVRIDPSIGEFYVHTVAQAEAYGFRRALRWKGSDK